MGQQINDAQRGFLFAAPTPAEWWNGRHRVHSSGDRALTKGRPSFICVALLAQGFRQRKATHAGSARVGNAALQAAGQVGCPFCILYSLRRLLLP